MALTGIPRRTEKGLSGLKYLLIADYDELASTVSAGAVTFTLSDGTAIDNSNNPFKRYDVLLESSNYTATGTGAEATGTFAVNQVVTAVFTRDDKAIEQEIAVLKDIWSVVICVDRNGLAKAFGTECGMVLSGTVGTSGTAPTDGSLNTLTFNANETNQGLEADLTNANPTA